MEVILIGIGISIMISISQIISANDRKIISQNDRKIPIISDFSSIIFFLLIFTIIFSQFFFRDHFETQISIKICKMRRIWKGKIIFYSIFEVFSRFISSPNWFGSRFQSKWLPCLVLCLKHDIFSHESFAFSILFLSRNN